MAVRPGVREVMNALIGKLEHEMKTRKSSNKGLEASGSKGSEVVVGTRKRSENTTHTFQNIPIRITTQTRTQPLLKPNKSSTSSNSISTVCPATLELVNDKVSAKRKIVLIGDSHARGCASKLQEKLKEYKVTGYVIPGAEAAVLTRIAQQEISELTEKDILIYW